MRRFYIGLLALLCWGSTASAQEQYALTADTPRWVEVKPKPEPPPLFAPDSQLRLFGVTFLVGLPDGIAPGLSFHPWTNLVHIDLSLAGALSFGVRAGVTLDPFDWIVAPTLTLAVGYLGWADVPFATDDRIRFETSYVNIQPGIELGRRSLLRIFLRAGYSHLWVNTDFFPRSSGGQATSAVKGQINLVPSLNLGVTAYL